MTAFDALTPEPSRLLVLRDLTAAARHALDIEADPDEVEIIATFNKDGMTLDVTYRQGKHAIAGWGQ